MGAIPRVVVVILSWNRCELTLECLHSLSHLDYPSDKLKLVLVDNASVDDTVQQVTVLYPDVIVIENSSNRGYTGGNNIGIRWAIDFGCEYIWLLNNDVLVMPDTLQALIVSAHDRSEGAFFGPKVKMQEELERIMSAGGLLRNGWRSTHRGMGMLDQDQYQQVCKVDFLSGCALLVKTAMLGDIGLLDERYYLYHEDVEWCYRARNKGYFAYFVPQAIVWHPDTRQRDEDSGIVTYYTTRNQLMFIKQYLGYGNLFNALMDYMRILLSWTIKPKWRYKGEQRSALFWALADFTRKRYGPR